MSVPGRMLTEQLSRLTDEARRLRESNEQKDRSDRGRQLAAGTERAIARRDRVVAEHRRLRGEPLVDQAIATGALPFEEREEALRRFEFSPELAASELERLQPDPAQATRNFFAADDADAAYRRETAARLGIRPEDVV